MSSRRQAIRRRRMKHRRIAENVSGVEKNRRMAVTTASAASKSIGCCIAACALNGCGSVRCAHARAAHVACRAPCGATAPLTLRAAAFRACCLFCLYNAANIIWRASCALCCTALFYLSQRGVSASASSGGSVGENNRGISLCGVTAAASAAAGRAAGVWWRGGVIGGSIVIGGIRRNAANKASGCQYLRRRHA